MKGKINFLKLLSLIVLSLGIMLATSGCTEEEINELFGIESDEYDDNPSDSGNSGGGVSASPGYTYNYTCPASGKATAPIPAASAKCQKALEFFARTYACNDVNNFNAANCRVCADCGDEWQNYCQLCN